MIGQFPPFLDTPFLAANDHAAASEFRTTELDQAHALFSKTSGVPCVILACSVDTKGSLSRSGDSATRPNGSGLRRAARYQDRRRGAILVRSGQ